MQKDITEFTNAELAEMFDELRIALMPMLKPRWAKTFEEVNRRLKSNSVLFPPKPIYNNASKNIKKSWTRQDYKNYIIWLHDKDLERKRIKDIQQNMRNKSS